MGKTVQVSARISQEDAAFLASLQISGAHTPSDKLRAIITEARHRQAGQESYRDCVRMVDNLLEPTRLVIGESELRHKMHSDLIPRVLDWLPDMLGLVVASRAELSEDESIESMVALETAIADRVFRLMESVLQMGVTQRCPCYRDNAIRERVEPVKDLITAIGVLEEKHA